MIKTATTAARRISVTGADMLLTSIALENIR